MNKVREVLNKVHRKTGGRIQLPLRPSRASDQLLQGERLLPRTSPRRRAWSPSAHPRPRVSRTPRPPSRCSSASSPAKGRRPIRPPPGAQPAPHPNATRRRAATLDSRSEASSASRAARHPTRTSRRGREARAARERERSGRNARGRVTTSTRRRRARSSEARRMVDGGGRRPRERS